MSALITGGAGYVGSTLVDDLLKRDYRVISIDNLYRGDYRYLQAYKDNPSLRMEIADITKIEELEKVFKSGEEPDAIVHLAAIPGIVRCLEDPKRAILTNILGTFNVLEISRKYDIDKVIFASSAAVFGIPKITPIKENYPLNPVNLYGVTKLAGEKNVESYNLSHGLNAIILRLGNIYGVGLYTYWETVIPKFIKQSIMGEALTVYGTGEQSRDFIHVRDVTQAIILALNTKENSCETFNVSSGEATSINMITDKISAILKSEMKKEVKIKYLPPREDEPYVENFCLSIDKIRDKMHFKPKWTIDEGIRQLARYYLESEYGDS